MFLHKVGLESSSTVVHCVCGMQDAHPIHNHVPTSPGHFLPASNGPNNIYSASAPVTGLLTQGTSTYLKPYTRICTCIHPHTTDTLPRVTTAIARALTRAARHGIIQLLVYHSGTGHERPRSIAISPGLPRTRLSCRKALAPSLLSRLAGCKERDQRPSCC